MSSLKILLTYSDLSKGIVRGVPVQVRVFDVQLKLRVGRGISLGCDTFLRVRACVECARDNVLFDQDREST